MKISSPSSLRQATALLGSTVVALSFSLAVVAAADTQTYDNWQQLLMQPEVRRYTSVIPKEVCDTLVELMEKRGFDMDNEPVDNGEDEEYRKPTQQIDVYKRGDDPEIVEPDLYDAMAPYIDEVAALVMKQRSKELHQIMHPGQPEKLPVIDWIFMRKYAPHSERNSIILHGDSNLHTVNLQLNDDYKGGGLFYIKPPVVLNQEWMEEHVANYNWKNDCDKDYHHKYKDKPRLWKGRDEYKWVEAKGRLNSSEVVFPEAGLGDAIIHNHTVWHGVAPIDEGARYSLIFFFDQDNPMLDDEGCGDSSDDESGDSGDDENDGQFDSGDEDETDEL